MHRKTRIAVAVLLVVALVLACTGTALAAPDPGSTPDAKAAGDGIGKMIRGIAAPIVWSLAGLTALGAFMKRDVGLAFTMLVITVILGLFVTDAGQKALQGFTDMLAKALGA